MTATTIRVQMAQRKDTAANWTAANPILLSGEIGYETDTKKFKIGNGSTAWNSLAYLPIPDGSGNLTITGNLEIGSTGSLTFEGSTADGFETTLAVTNPTADRTITLPDVTGTVVTTGDTGSVTSTMIANGTIVDADVSSTAEIAVSKLANGTANQVIVTDGTNVSWSDNLTLAGDLTVNGTTTTINTQDLLVEDKNIIIGNVATPSDVTADGGGITLKGATDKTINWVDATDAWTLSEHVNIASGKEYRIAGTKVLDATSLGSAVVSSSLTSVGTITSGTWQGTAINATYLDSTVVKTSDTGTVTSAMLADGTIVDGDISATAEIAVSKLADGSARQLLQTDAAGTGVEWASNIDIPGTLDVTGAATLDSTLSVPLGSAGSPSIYPGTDTNTGIYSPGADQLAISTGGTGRLFVDSTGRVGVNTSTFADARDSLIVSPAASQTSTFFTVKAGSTSGNGWLFFGDTDSNSVGGIAYEHANDAMAFRTNGSERLRIDSSGRLGLGTSSPTSLAHLSLASNTTYDATNLNLATHALNITNTSTTASTSSSLIFQSTGSGGSAIGAIALVNTGANAGALTFATRGGASATPERMRIDSSGRVGIGTTSPSYIFHALTSDTTSAAFRNPGAANTQILIGNTAGDTAIRTTSAGDALIYSDTGKSLGLGTNGATTRLHITSAGLVGIGTTSPSVALQVSGQIRNNNGYLIDNGTNAGFLTADGSNINIGSSTAAKGLAFFTGATSEAARLDASGRLLVGTSTARQNWFNGTSLAPQVQIEGAGLGARLSIVRNDASANGHGLILGKTRGSSYEIVSAEDPVGYVSFQGADGAELVEAARIETVIDGTPGANNMPGRIVLSTTSNGATSPTERLRITSAGVLQIADAGNISVGTTTGTKIGTATTQKLGFFNKTPVVQPTAVADATDAASVITQLNALLARMRDLGLIAT